MSEIAPYRPHSAEIAPVMSAPQALIEWARSADAAYQLAEKLCTSAFVPAQFKGKPVEAAAAMIAGAEVGLSPMASLRAFDVIQGVAAPRALTMRAVAQSQGHEFVTDESTPQKCVMRGRRRGSSEWQTVTWTMQRATQLGLSSKEQWKKQPQTMLVARATTELVRMVAADAILGIGYSAEEVEDTQPEPTVTVTRSTQPAKRAQRKPAQPTAEPELEPAPADGPVETVGAEPLRTEPQMRKLWALAKQIGLGDADDFKAYLSQELGRPVESTKDLTKDEAGKLIEQLEAIEPGTGEVRDQADGQADGQIFPEAGK